MEFRLRSVAFAPGDRSEQEPLTARLLRQIPGPDRPDYWLAELNQSVEWSSAEEGSFEVTHVVLATEWEKTALAEGATRLPVGIAYVIDMSLLGDDELDIEKIHFVATGVADDVNSDDTPLAPLRSRMDRFFDRIFGKRISEK